MKILLLFFALVPICIPQQKHLIDWKEGERLEWKDFKQRVPPDAPNAALTSSAVGFQFTYGENKFIFHIQCQFDKNQSWGRVKNDYILSHEQGHFDITEIYARKLFKLLSAYTVGDVNTVSRDVNKIYEKTMQELNATQTKYDRETNNSVNRTAQAEWLADIQKQLTELHAYADYH